MCVSFKFVMKKGYGSPALRMILLHEDNTWRTLWTNTRDMQTWTTENVNVRARHLKERVIVVGKHLSCLKMVTAPWLSIYI